MNHEKKSDKRGKTPRKSHPFPPEGMDLTEYLDLKEKAKSYIEMVMYLYSNLASKEVDSQQKEKFDNESNRHADLLKSMKWMEVEVAKPIVAEYPDLIRRLREKDKRRDS